MNVPIFREVLLKLAARCNLNCTYCYWFRDASVYRKPPILTSEAEAAFLARLEEHIQAHDLEGFSLILHGGEPLLFGKARFVSLMDSLDAIERSTGCAIYRSLTTNGVLVDTEWAQLFRIFRVSVTVSIDGPAPVHDRARVDFQGRGSYERVLQGLARLREQGLEPGVLAVCDPKSDPSETLSHFVDELGFSSFDILIPDATHDDSPTSIAPYYMGLFDLWRASYRQREVTIRFLRSVLNGLFEDVNTTIYNPVGTLTVLTDGALEPVDVLRIAGYNSTRTELSVQTHPLQALESDPCWREAYRATIELPGVCQECAYLKACAGGYLPHRWSSARRFANPSVYCADLKRIYAHIRATEFAERNNHALGER